MRIGVHLPFRINEGDFLAGPTVMEIAKQVQDAGFESAWFSDSFGAMQKPDPFAWLLAAAMGAQQLEVGTCIYIVPTREPIDLAHRLLTLHTLTQGRFTIGVGAGSGGMGFAAVGGSFEGRFTKLNHDLKLMKRIFNGEGIDGAAPIAWPSAIGGPPILIGAWSSPIWLRKAAQDYEGWMPSGSYNRSKGAGDETTFATLKENIGRFRDLGGKRAVLSSVHIDLNQPNGHLADDEPFNLHCGPESATERLAKVAAMGYDDLILWPQRGRGTGPFPDREQLAKMRGIWTGM